MNLERVEHREGFSRWGRIAVAGSSLVLLALGVTSVFTTEGGLASASLIVLGGVLGYVALTNARITEMSASGVKLEHVARVLEDVLASPDVPEEVKERVAAEVQPLVERLPVSVRDEVRAATHRSGRKKDLLADLCDESGIARLPLGTGSTLPADAFRAAAAVAGLAADGSMPTVAERIVEAAGMEWSDLDWSRGSTVTLSGLGKVLEAVRLLKARAGVKPKD